MNFLFFFSSENNEMGRDSINNNTVNDEEYLREYEISKDIRTKHNYREKY